MKSNLLIIQQVAFLCKKLFLCTFSNTTPNNRFLFTKSFLSSTISYVPIILQLLWRNEMIQKINRLSLVEQVAEQMEQLIEQGQWKVGEKLPA